jgi:hypothetical protein
MLLVLAVLVAPVVLAVVVSLIDCLSQLNLQVATSVSVQTSAKNHSRFSFFVQSFIFVSFLCSSPE